MPPNTKDKINSSTSTPIAEIFGIYIFAQNILISFLVYSNDYNFELNNHPLGLPIPLWTSVVLALCLLGVIILLNYFQKYRLVSTLIIAGIASNLFERFLFGGVRDYINIGIAYINLADIGIGVGVVLINIYEWLGKKNN